MKPIVAQLYYFGLIVAFLILPVVQHGYASNEGNESVISKRRKLARNIGTLRGKREGVICGIGAGVGYTNFTAPLAAYWGDAYEGSWPDPRAGAYAFATEIKLGHGFTEQFLLYYTSHITWLPLSNLYRDTMIANGSAGAGVMYFPLRSVDFYFIGSLRLAVLTTWHPPFKLEKARQTGLAVSGGIGYEFLPHLTLDFTVNFGHANMTHFDDPKEIKFANEIVTYLVTLSALAY